jgi:hypothetical protein
MYCSPGLFITGRGSDDTCTVCRRSETGTMLTCLGDTAADTMAARAGSSTLVHGFHSDTRNTILLISD